MTPPDPNWLYATIAAVMTTVVAIIGGFLLAAGLSVQQHARESERTYAYLKAAQAEVQGRYKALIEGAAAEGESIHDFWEEKIKQAVLEGKITLEEASRERAERDRKLSEAAIRGGEYQRKASDLLATGSELNRLALFIRQGLLTLLLVVAFSVLPPLLLPADPANRDYDREAGVKWLTVWGIGMVVQFAFIAVLGGLRQFSDEGTLPPSQIRVKIIIGVTNGFLVLLLIYGLYLLLGS